MFALPSIYRAQFKTALALMIQYRVSMMIWMIDTVLRPIVYLTVWSNVASADGGAALGFSAGDFAAYYIVLMAVQHMTDIWHMWTYEYDIRQGNFSFKLLRPLHPIHGDIAENLAFKALMFIVVIPAIVLLTLLFHPTLNPPLWALLTFVPAVVMAAVVGFLAGWVLAMAAFWSTRIVAINGVYFVAMLFFSGQIAPLELMPPVAQGIASLLPFRWILGFPVELLLGRLAPEAAIAGFAAQALWLAILLTGLQVVWRAAVRRYGAVGG